MPLLTADQIAAKIADAFGRNIQDEIHGVVQSTASPIIYHAYVKIEQQEETYLAPFSPFIDTTTLAEGTRVLLEYNRDGVLAIVKPDDIAARESYSSDYPTKNFVTWQHNHETSIGGGQLNATNIFNSGAVPLSRGGGAADLSGFATGSLIYKAADSFAEIVDIATGNVLLSGGVSTVPAYGKVGLTTHVSGTLAVGNGGTGAASFTANSVLLGNGTSAFQEVAPGSSGNVLTSNGTTWTSAAPMGGGGGWTDDGTVVRLTTSTDNVSIGTATGAGKLFVAGDADEVQLQIRGNGTQTQNVVIVETSAAATLFSIGASGAITMNGSVTQDAGAVVFNEAGADYDHRIEGDTDSNLFFVDASTDRIGIGTASPTARLHVAPRAVETQLLVRGFSGMTTQGILEVQEEFGSTIFIVRNGGETYIAAASIDNMTLNGVSGTGQHMLRSSSRNALHWYPVGAQEHRVPGVLWTPNAIISAITATSGTSLTGGEGSFTIKANMWQTGRVMRITIDGNLQTNSSGTNRSNLDILIGATTVVSVDTTVLTTSINRPFQWVVNLRCVSVSGANATLRRTALFISPDVGVCRTNISGSGVNVTTTSDQTLGIQLYWTGTSNQANIESVAVEWLN